MAETDTPRDAAAAVCAEACALLAELRPGAAPEVAPASRIDRDLGIDSLGRAELILRLERRFHVQLPDQVMAEADTLADLTAAVIAATSAAGVAAAPPAPSAAPLPAGMPELDATPVAARTLVEVLEWHAARHPERLHVTVLRDDETALGAFTYGALAAEARRIAAGLAARGLAPGERIALMLPTGLDFFAAFAGVLLAGAVPVPIYPPARRAALEEHIRRQAGILADAGAALLITAAAAEGGEVGRLLRGLVGSLRGVDSAAHLARLGAGAGWSPPRVADAAPALIQYTSGSTGAPKGVVLSHANLLANIRAMGTALKAGPRDVFVSWLPLYHDMGLIGAWLGSLYYGGPVYVMSPLAFLARPARWLRALSRYGGTLTAAPNFAYALCLARIDDAELAALDLSRVRFAANGAEPVSPRTVQAFIARFAAAGFRAEAMAPVYGLAENAVGLAFPPLGRAPVIDRVDRAALAAGTAAPAGTDDPHPLELVGCGRPLPGHELRIADEAGRELAERREGRIQFRGPSATAGYFANPRLTAGLIRDGWHDTGDRGYLAGGELFITGRIKDMIIRAGRNIHPAELEDAVGEIAGVRRGAVAVFGVPDAATGTERLVIAAETRAAPAEHAALRARIVAAAGDILGEPPDEVALVPPRAVPKTSSGKIRRGAARELYLAGRLGAAEGRRRQIVRLALLAARGVLGRGLRAGAELAYAARWWAVIGPAWGLGVAAALILPTPAWRWAALRGLARAAVGALGVPVTVDGREHLRSERAVIAVNHASYIDALLLAAVMPGPISQWPAYIAKREFAGHWLIGPVLRRLGVLFVERFDAAAGLADARAAAALAADGRPLVFFAEGTFGRAPGLRAFKLGAFAVAAEAGLPVVPVALVGTRAMLRDGQWFPRAVPLAVRVAPPVMPTGPDFEATVRLRDAARGAILARCGEPDLGAD